jgi:four helix bundle protein
MTSKIYSYEDLTVYQLAFELAIKLHHITLSFPKIEQYSLADQIRRASRSICANIAEGYARRAASVIEFKRFLSMAFGSAAEMQVWMNFAKRLNYIDQKSADDFISKYVEVSKMLRALGKAWHKR